MKPALAIAAFAALALLFSSNRWSQLTLMVALTIVLQVRSAINM